MEEHIINYSDGSETEIPINRQEVDIQKVKHIAVLRNLADDIKNNVNSVIKSIESNDFLAAGVYLERIRNLANSIIEES